MSFYAILHDSKSANPGPSRLFPFLHTFLQKLLNALLSNTTKATLVSAAWVVSFTITDKMACLQLPGRKPFSFLQDDECPPAMCLLLSCCQLYGPFPVSSFPAAHSLSGSPRGDFWQFLPSVLCTVHPKHPCFFIPNPLPFCSTNHPCYVCLPVLSHIFLFFSPIKVSTEKFKEKLWVALFQEDLK